MCMAEARRIFRYHSFRIDLVRLMRRVHWFVNYYLNGLWRSVVVIAVGWGCSCASDNCGLGGCGERRGGGCVGGNGWGTA